MDSDSNREESKASLRFNYNHDQLIVDTTPYEQKSSARNSSTTPRAIHRKRPMSQGRKIVSLPKSRPSVGQEYNFKTRLSLGTIFVDGKQSYEASLLEKISNQKSQIANLKKELESEGKVVKVLMSNSDNYCIGRYVQKVKKWKHVAVEKEKEIKQKEKEINELKKNKGVSKVSELEKEINVLTKICKNLEEQLAENAVDVKIMHEDAKKVELKIKGYEKEISALKTENKDIICKYLEKDSAISELKKKIDKLSKRKLAKRNQALKKEVERLKLKLEGNPFAIASNSIQKNIMVNHIQNPPIISRNKIEKKLMITHIENTKLNNSEVQTKLLITHIKSAIKNNPNIESCISNIDIEPVHKNEKFNQAYRKTYELTSKNRLLSIETHCSVVSIKCEAIEPKPDLNLDIQCISYESLIKPESLSVQFEHFSLCMAADRVSKFDVPEYLFEKSFYDKMTKDDLLNHLKSFDHLSKMSKLDEFCAFLIEPSIWELQSKIYSNKKIVGQICAKLLAYLSNWEIIEDNEEEIFDQHIKMDFRENISEFQKICKKADQKNSGCIHFTILEKIFLKFLTNPPRKLLYYLKVLCFSISFRIDSIPYINVCHFIKSRQESSSTPKKIDESSENIKILAQQQFLSENFEFAQSMNKEEAIEKQVYSDDVSNNHLSHTEYIKKNTEIKEEETCMENKSDIGSEENQEQEQEISEEEEKEVNQKINEETLETKTVEETKEITESETEFQHEEFSKLGVHTSCEHKNYEISSNKNRKGKDEYEIISNTEIERSLTSFEDSSQSEREISRAEDEEDYNIA